MTSENATEIYAVSNKNLDSLLPKLKEDLDSFTDLKHTLADKLESTSKHLPTYLKIIKTHINQLSSVLDTDEHFHKKIENIPLAEPVKQLIALFRFLEEEDLKFIEKLTKAAKGWNPENKQTQEIKQSDTIAS